MLKFASCVVAVCALAFFPVASAPATTIDFRPALIPHMGSPLPVPLAIDLAVPTTNDTISFTAPLDGEIHGNRWAAAADFLGDPILNIDEVNRAINIRFDGVFSEIYPEIYEPVTGAWGEFGPLAAGDWILHNSHGGSLAFTVVPEPASLLLLTVGAAGMLARRRRRR